MRHRHFKTLRGAERYRDKLRERRLKEQGLGFKGHDTSFIVWVDNFGWAVALIDRSGKRIALCA